MEVTISNERKDALMEKPHWMRRRDKCTQRELLSLIGKSSFCCKVLPAGRIFLRRMIDHSNTLSCLHHHISLTTEAYLDLQWWLDFLPTLSGISLILNTRWIPSPALHLTQTHPDYKVGMHTGMADGSKVIGHHYRATWILHGRNYLL